MYKRIFIVLLLTVFTLSEKSEKKNKDRKTHPKVKEFKETAHLRPTKCQVCRVMVQELTHELNKTKDSKEKISVSNGFDGNKNSYIPYEKSELRLMDTLEKICGNVEYYRTIAGPAFPYLRNVRSMFRQEIEDMMEVSGLHLKMDGPENTFEDPTFEIRRLHYECSQMIEEYEEEILEWFQNKQHENLINYLCKERVLISKENGCLNASIDIPDYIKKPKYVSDKEMIFDYRSKSEL